MKFLVIVESPAKCGKIQKFLNGFGGNSYIVKASFGHFRDLAKGLKAIDINNNFQPSYRITKAKIVKELKAAAKKCDEVVIATDLDREGEGIGMHILSVLKLKQNTTKRIVFNQITKKAVCNAMANPRTLDMNLVNAQQARRILDRLVGFELSPLLWRHVQSKLSAGRCQSPALKLIYDREKQIENFQSSNYFETSGTFINNDIPIKLEGVFQSKYNTKGEATKLLEDCKTADFQLINLKKKESKNNPPPPYTTSTLQQDASNKLSMGPKMCMQVAQKLYEGGAITYMRTDSVELSPEALAMCKQHIVETYGEENYKFRKYKSKSSNAQEAHEAIRPVYINKTQLEGLFSAAEKRLYSLIHNRTVASQMAASKKDIFTGTIIMSNRSDIIISKYEYITFLGYLRVYNTKLEPRNETIYKMLENESLLPVPLEYIEITSKEKTTKSVGRYTEATLIKELEKRGIGRPSTFSNLITIIQDRKYVIRETRKGKEINVHILTLKPRKEINVKTTKTTTNNEKNKLFITDVGRVTTEFLQKHFDSIMSYDFTGDVEKELDKIASGNSVWYNVVRGVYNSFHPTVVKLSDRTMSIREKHSHKRNLGENAQGEPILAYLGKYGPVLQIGMYEDHKKNKFCSVPKEMSIETITLQQALELSQYPKNLGVHEGTNVILKKGPYGFYLYYKSNVSIPNVEQMDISKFTLHDAIPLLSGGDSKGPIKEFGKDLSIRNGPYGIYIRYKKKNVSLPKTIKNPEKLTKQQVMEIIKTSASKPKRKYKKKK